jgi:hypothetical protein
MPGHARAYSRRDDYPAVPLVLGGYAVAPEANVEPNDRGRAVAPSATADPLTKLRRVSFFITVSSFS